MANKNNPCTAVKFGAVIKQVTDTPLNEYRNKLLVAREYKTQHGDSWLVGDKSTGYGAPSLGFADAARLLLCCLAGDKPQKAVKRAASAGEKKYWQPDSTAFSRTRFEALIRDTIDFNGRFAEIGLNPMKHATSLAFLTSAIEACALGVMHPMDFGFIFMSVRTMPTPRIVPDGNGRFVIDGVSDSSTMVLSHSFRSLETGEATIVEARFGYLADADFKERVSMVTDIKIELTDVLDGTTEFYQQLGEDISGLTLDGREPQQPPKQSWWERYHENHKP